MKVIGRSESGYLISAGDDEIARLFGAAWAGGEEFQKILGAAGKGQYGSLVGLEINVNEAYNQLAWLRHRNSEFDYLCKKLRQTADAIQNSKPLFDAIVGDKP